MPEQLVLYVEVADAGDAAGLADAIRGLESVHDVDAQVEEPVRGPAETIESVTLVITAAGGAVAAANSLIDQIRKLIAKFPVRSAQVETEDGLRELTAGGEPRNEKPAQ